MSLNPASGAPKPSDAAAAVELRGLSKRFGDRVAVDGVDLVLGRGEIHGLIGENGAGKSTCMKMLYGLLAPDAGEIFAFGERRKWSSPLAASAAGIGMVHQHFMLVDDYTALDNIVLGAEPASSVWRFLPPALRPIDRKAAAVRIAELGRQYGLSVPLDVPVGELSLGLQQRIEILKLLYRNARVLILDEPTAVLTPIETRELFKNLKQLRAEGCSILIITHKLEEVLELCDRVSVLRTGKLVACVEPQLTKAEDLAALMVGHAVNLHQVVPPARTKGEFVLEVEGLSVAKATGALHGARTGLEHISLAVRAGEIVGIAGVEGNGQSELLKAITHPRSQRPHVVGSIKVLGCEVAQASAQQIKKLGLGYIPQDRHREGLLLEAAAEENCLLGYERRSPLSQGGLISRKALREKARLVFSEFDVRPPFPEQRAQDFSGGNQQKIIIGRELYHRPRLILAAHPTRGVDVGAIEFIHSRLVKARDEGAGILLISSDLDEIMSLCDRILVLCGGRLVAEYTRGSCTVEDLGLSMGGGSAHV